MTCWGLLTPRPVPLLPVPVQIAQRLHACSAPGSQRAQDLVDLQLLTPGADLLTVATLYAEAAAGLDVLPDVVSAVAWADDHISRLAEAD